MAKCRAEASREGEEKPFSGAAADEAHNHLRRRVSSSSAVPASMSNQMLDFLKGYLNNIAAATTQAVENGGPLAEFSVSLAISVDTVAAQSWEIKRLYEHINALKKKRTPTSSSGRMA